MTLGTHQWLELKVETRRALAKIFHLTPSGHTHVVDNVVESDGYTAEDLEPMTVEEMNKLTHLDSDNFEQQFNLIVKMVEGESTQEFNAPAGAETLQNHEPGTDQPTSAEPTPTGGEAEDQSPVSPGSGSQAQAETGQGDALPVPRGSKHQHRGRGKSLSGSNGLDQAGMAKQTTEVDPGILKNDGHAGQAEPGVQEV